jgi:hypothetical protein
VGAGSIYEYRCRYQVVIEIARVKYAKSFSFDGVEANRELALKEAESWRCQESDRLGLTKKIYASGQNQSMRKYIAGLFDGDGSMGIYRSSAFVSISQSCNNEVPAVIALLRGIYDGTHTTVNPAKKEIRRKHVLTLTALKCLPLLYDILPFLPVKQGQAQLIYDWLRNRDEYSREATRILANDLRLMKVKEAYQSVVVRHEQLSDEYVTGFFDAEGCVVIRGDLCMRVEFNQLQSPSLLTCLAKYFASEQKVRYGKV